MKIVIYTLYDEEKNILLLSRLGVKAILSKTIGHDLLFSALKLVAQGGYCYSAKAGIIVQNHIKHAKAEGIGVTDSERSILKLICEGKSSSEIADIVCKSPRTVEDHRQKLYRKFNVPNKEQLIMKWMMLGAE